MKTLLMVFALFIALFTKAQDTIVKTDLPVAAKIFDLQFNQQEIDSMYDGVKDTYKTVKQMHGISLKNSTPMSLWQTPVLPGMHFAEKKEPVNWHIPSNVQLPTRKNE